ncbi:hypothetical protein FOS14_11090 [Skermania sp. ID1734]|uniref:hypothetical protein n=1 Tax=Skermania sp. ID1734 TaxID=2597516 RepID=UPI00117D3E1D|nr:hypothetical protein [Skermania sp. ID1734]TSD99786.1 hypothetical protein FOS14_11090 [Skermania sp. ID1734]
MSSLTERREKDNMPTEVTASLMIGPITADSYHGTATWGSGKWFCPSHTLLLMEGSRPSWVVQPIQFTGRPAPAFRIDPSSREHLLAAGVLGYVALTAPHALDLTPRLQGTVAQASGDKGLRIGRINRDLAADVFTVCEEFVDGVVTVMPGSTITAEELDIAACHGLRVAAAANGRSVDLSASK